MGANTTIECTDGRGVRGKAARTRILVATTATESMNRWLRRGENWVLELPRGVHGHVHWEKALRSNAKLVNAHIGFLLTPGPKRGILPRHVPRSSVEQTLGTMAITN